MLQGQVDVAALSFESYEKAVRENVPGVRDVKIIARSDPIPYPPLVVNSKLPAATRNRLQSAFQNIAHEPGITQEMIRGYGGGQVDGYDAHSPAAKFTPAAQKMAMVSDALKALRAAMPHLALSDRELADMFAAADVMLLNKVDLLPHLNFDVPLVIENARRVNPHIHVILTSAVSGAGMEEWQEWIEAGMKNCLVETRANPSKSGEI